MYNRENINACMFINRYANLANDYKILKYELDVLIERINWYQDVKNRMKNMDYIRTVNKADKLVGEILILEDKMNRAYIEFNS
jgi:hypothetical protein